MIHEFFDKIRENIDSLNKESKESIRIRQQKKISESLPFQGQSDEDKDAILRHRELTQYKSFDEAFRPGEFQIWYYKSTGTDTEYGQEADFNMGYRWCKDHNKLPDPDDLSRTHVNLGSIHRYEGSSDHAMLRNIYQWLQGEFWSPKGEARHLIHSLGLQHTSMSVGDIIEVGNDVWMVDRIGFVNLRNPSSVEESVNEALPFQGQSEDDKHAAFLSKYKIRPITYETCVAAGKLIGKEPKVFKDCYGVMEFGWQYFWAGKNKWCLEFAASSKYNERGSFDLDIGLYKFTKEWDYIPNTEIPEDVAHQLHTVFNVTDPALVARKIKSVLWFLREIEFDGIKNLKESIMEGWKEGLVAGALAGMAALNPIQAQAAQPKKHTQVQVRPELRALVGEAENQGLEGMQAMASAIRNRKKLPEYAKNPLKGVYGLKRKFKKAPPKWVWAQAEKAWKDSETKDYADGAQFWGTDKDVTKWKRQPWFKRATFVKRVKDHNFYKVGA